MTLSQIFPNSSKPIIGMIHLLPLPGSPRSDECALEKALERALDDVKILEQNGIDGLMIENFGDYPFYKDKVPAYVIAYITAIALQIKRICSLPLGINVLRNDANAALSIADAIGADYIRVNIHSGAMLTDQGIIEGKAAHTIRLKKILKSNVKIWADVQVKHAAPLAISYDLLDIAKDTYYRGMADAIILSGKATGSSIEIKELKRLKNALPQIPIIIGSGVDTYNIAQILEIADAVIVGTSIKEDGITTNPVSVEKVRTLLERFER